MDKMEIRRRIVEDGYAVLPGLLSEEKILQLNSIVGNFFKKNGTLYNLGKTQPNASMECPDLGFVFYDPKVVEAFRAAIGVDDIVFTGHCDIHQDMFSSWHKDTGRDHGYFEEDCFVDDCCVVKMGIYLQDQAPGDGLTIQPGSHREHEIRFMKGTPLATKAGDAVLFDVRISHHGRLADRVDRFLHLMNKGQKKVRARIQGSKKPGDIAQYYAIKQLYDRALQRSTRRSIFFTYGAPNRFTEQFSRANMVRQQGQYLSHSAYYPEELIEGLQMQGVKLFDPASTSIA